MINDVRVRILCHIIRIRQYDSETTEHKYEIGTKMLDCIFVPILQPASLFPKDWQC